MDALLVVDAIDVHYGDVQALWGASLQVGAGELVAVVGPNGSGKTTLLRAIQGLQRPTRGAIWLRGERIDDWPAHRRVQQGLAAIPEGRHLFPDMTVRENLELGAYTPRARAARAEALDLVFALFPTLAERPNASARTLSGGQQQMLAIGRGLMSRPEILLLDDPFLGLARNVTARFCETLKRINHGGLTVIVAGQHVRRLLGLAGRAYLLDAGRVTLEGSAAALAGNVQLQRAVLLGRTE